MKKLPIEFYLLAVWVIVVALQFSLVQNAVAVFFNLPKAFLYYSFFGGIFFLLFALIFNLYLAGRIMLILTDPLFEGRAASFREARRQVWQLLREWFLASALLAGFALCAFISTIALNTKFVGANVRTAAASTALMKADQHVFGGYPMFALQHPFGTEPWSSILLWSYGLLIPAIAIFVFYALVRKPVMVRKFFLAFFLAQLLALSFWYAVPAVSPYSMYVQNSLKQPPPAFLAGELSSYAPSGALASYFKALGGDQQGGTDVASFPSMHAAWGSEIAILGAAEGGLGIIFAPWAVAEMIGAMYNGEHYGVDILAGIVIAVLSLLIAKALLKFEKKYYTGKTSFLIGEMLQEDYRKARQWLTKIF